MANYANLKATINANIKANGAEEITGPILNNVLNAAVNALGAGWQYMGVATPATSPGTPDANVFYIASTAGTYTNFGGLAVAEGEVAILKYNGSWAKEVTGAATAAQVTQLGQEVDTNKTNITNLQQEIDDIQPIIIEGNVTNAPDEEDITTDANDLLKFADRPTAVNQMGYVILRKNKTFAEQVTDENTIYEIRYEFTLAANFTMPNNCAIRFNGGSISGAYTLTGKNTRIDASIVKIFGTDVTVSGSWAVDEAYPEWFGAVGDGVTDDRLAFQKCIDSFRTTRVRDGSYLMATMTDTANRICLVMPEKHEICATDNMLTSRPMIKANCSPKIVIQVQTRCIVSGLSIDGGNEFNQDYSNLTYKTVGIGSGSAWAPGLEIKDCFIYKCYYGMDLTTYLSTIHHNSALSCYIGFYIHGDGLSNPESVPSSRGTSTSITNNYANNCQSYGYAIIGMSYSTISTNACDCCGYNTFSSAFSYAYRFTYLRGCTIQSNGAEACIFAYYLNALENVTMISCVAALTKIDGYSSAGENPLKMGILHATEIRGLWFITDNTFASGEIDSLKFVFKSNSTDSFSAYEIRVNGSMLTASQIQMSKYSDSSCLKYYTPRLGTTAERPTGLDYRVALGTPYYDTDLQRFLIYANGWKTTEGDNASFKTSGTSAERPNSNSIRIGFVYFDTTLGKPIWAKSVSGYTIEWVDATGASV